MWIVAQVAAAPAFLQLGWLEGNVADPGQPPMAGDPPGVGPAQPGPANPPPPNAPALPTPNVPNTPGNHFPPFGGAGGGLPSPIPPVTPQDLEGALGGGLLVHNLDNHPIDFVLPGGIIWRIPEVSPGAGRGSGFYVIPLGGGNELHLQPYEGRWLVRVNGGPFLDPMRPD